MKISALSGYSTIRNYGRVQNKKRQDRPENKGAQNTPDSLSNYPKNYKPSFGVILECLAVTYAYVGLVFGVAYLAEYCSDKKYAKERNKEIEKVAEVITQDIQKLANKNNINFDEAKIYQDNYLKTAVIEPTGDGNEIGLNAVMGYSPIKYKIAVDYITPLVAKEKGTETKGGKIPNGMLLYGPEGSGKAHITEKTCEHLKHFGVNVTDITLDSDNHEENAEKITNAFEQAKESYKETGKYTVINFTNGIDNVFKKRNTNPETIPEVRAFLSCADNCSEEGVTWLGTATNPKELDPAVIRAGRTDIKLPIGYMENFAIADTIKYTLMKNGEKPSADELDYQKVVDVMNENHLVFTPPEYDNLIKSIQNQKLHPKQIIDEDMILDEMFAQYESKEQKINPVTRAKLKRDEKYIKEQEDKDVDLLSKTAPSSVEEDAAEQIKDKWPKKRPEPKPIEGEDMDAVWLNLDHISS